MTGAGKAKYSVCYCLFDHCLRLFQDIVRRGEMLNLMSNTDHKNWELQTSGGKTKTLPGACFLIPPPDAEALEKVDRCRVHIYHCVDVLCSTSIVFYVNEAASVVNFNKPLCVCVCSVWTER